jgi:hypothetical protein
MSMREDRRAIADTFWGVDRPVPSAMRQPTGRQDRDKSDEAAPNSARPR